MAEDLRRWLKCVLISSRGGGMNRVGEELTWGRGVGVGVKIGCRSEREAVKLFARFRPGNFVL